MTKIILIGNYILDKQESMQRFATMLEQGFIAEGILTEIWKPKVYFGQSFLNPYSGLGKYLNYIDKWLLYPLVLIWRIKIQKHGNENIHFHIADHSNAPYLKYLPTHKTSITCHDVLAIRGAMGFPDAYAQTSKIGKFYQLWIFSHLKTAKRLAAVSHFTLGQLNNLNIEAKADQAKENKWTVIHNAFNAPFKPIPKNDAHRLLKDLGFKTDIPFILHVGTSHPRKNRIFLLKVLKELESSWEGTLCLAGMPLDTKFLEEAKRLNLQHRIFSVVKPDHDHLVALYNAADAFMFPSLSEGFGWPVIEAQACGTPVIASNFQPMPEVSGGAALHEHPDNPRGFANAFLSLKEEPLRNRLIEKGFNNIKRFEVHQMISEYLKLFNRNPNK